MNTIGKKIYHLKNCHNSFDLAKKSIDKDPDGTIFWIDHIENTRGRQGRFWKCYDGQLLLTILLKPNFSTQIIETSLNQLIMAFSVATANILKSYNVHLKWPNDFIAQNKKVGGIIAETIWSKNKPRVVIIGIGLNVNNLFDPSDELYKTATSLKAISGKSIDIQLLFDDFLKESNKFYTVWQNLKETDNPIYKAWKNYQFYSGKIIKIHKNDGAIVTGQVDNFSLNYDIIVVDKFKIKHKINFSQTWKFELIGDKYVV